MPLFSDEDRVWLEDLSWDMQEVVDECCDFVQRLASIGTLLKRDLNVSIIDRRESYPSFHVAPAGFCGSPDGDPWM